MGKEHEHPERHMSVGIPQPGSPTEQNKPVRGNPYHPAHYYHRDFEQLPDYFQGFVEAIENDDLLLKWAELPEE